MRDFSQKTTRRRARRFFMASGLFLTAALLFVVFSRAVARPQGTLGEVRPDVSAHLPKDAPVGAQLELFETPASAHVVSYVSGGTGYAKLLVWDKFRFRYEGGEPTALQGADGARLEAVSRFSLVELGVGAPQLIAAEGPTGGAYTEGIMLLERTGSALSIVRRIDADGAARAAFFLRGASVQHAVDVAFEDVDGDGGKEAVVRSSETGDDSRETVAFSVYRWESGVFAYDEALSWALSTSGRVFPTP